MSIANSTIEWTREASGSWHDDFAIHPRDDTLVLRLPKERTLTHVTSTGETLPAFGRVSYSSVAFDRSGERLLVVDNAFNRQARDGTNVRVLSYPDGEVLQTIDDHVNTLATFCQDDTVIATAALAGGINLLDSKTGKEKLDFYGLNVSVGGVAFSPNGKRIAAICKEGNVKVWDREISMKAAHRKH